MYILYYDIFRLNVSVDDTFSVQIFDSHAYLFDSCDYHLLCKPFSFFKKLEEIAWRTKFHKEIDIILIMEVSV